MSGEGGESASRRQEGAGVMGVGGRPLTSSYAGPNIYFLDSQEHPLVALDYPDIGHL